MSEKTAKLDTWRPQGRPEENEDIKADRQLLIEIIYGLWHRKKEILEKMSMPSQPVSLLEIWREYQSRVELLKSIKQWPHPWHSKRYIDRRVNEISCPKYSLDGIPKVVSVTAGDYQPNQDMFKSP